MKKSVFSATRFFPGIFPVRLRYTDAQLPVEPVPVPGKAVLLGPPSPAGDLTSSLTAGDRVKTGQVIGNDPSLSLYSTVTGTVDALSVFRTINGEECKGYVILTEGTDEWADGTGPLSPARAGSPGFFQDVMRFYGIDPGGTGGIVINGFSSDIGIPSKLSDPVITENSIFRGLELISEHYSGPVYFIYPSLYTSVEMAAKDKQLSSRIRFLPRAPFFPNGMTVLIERFIHTLAGSTEHINIMDLEKLCTIVDTWNSGHPCIEKTITLIDEAMSPVKTLKVRIGTPLSELIPAIGLPENTHLKVVMGGPLRGVAARTLDTPVGPALDGLMLLPATRKEGSDTAACLNCGKCVHICPEKLQVNLITRYAEFSHFERCGDLDIDWCIECGLCAFVCSARRPLVQFIQHAKNELWLKNRDKASS